MFLDRYDQRQSAELSQDRNADKAYIQRIQRVLDAQASRFDTYVANRFGPTPLALNLTTVTSSIAASATSITVGNGAIVQANAFIVLYTDGTNPSEIVLVQSVSGNTVTLSSLTPTEYAHNAATQVKIAPGPISDWVCTKSMQRLYFRRNDDPEGMELDAKDADQWMNDLISYKITLPGFNRSGPIVLTEQNALYQWIPGLGGLPAGACCSFCNGQCNGTCAGCINGNNP